MGGDHEDISDGRSPIMGGAVLSFILVAWSAFAVGWAVVFVANVFRGGPLLDVLLDAAGVALVLCLAIDCRLYRRAMGRVADNLQFIRRHR
jgi:hypothetical protein